MQALEKQPPAKRPRHSLHKMLSSEIYTNTTTMMATATATAMATATASSSTATTTQASSPTQPAVLKPKKKKRRPKKRKRAGHATGCNNNNNNNSPTTTTTTNINNNNKSTHNQLEPALLGCVSSSSTSTSTSSRKCKAQYFQHDNRAAYFAKYESFHFTAQAAATTTAAALNYAAVAKKFKPLRPILASGAKKNRRTAAARKALSECACVCQNYHMTQCPQEAGVVKQTAELHCRERKKCRPNNATTMTTMPPMKININGQALPALLELLKQTPSTWLQTLLLGAAGSAATVGR